MPRQRSVMVSMARSQEIGVNSPDPLGPLLKSGVVSLSGEWTLFS